MNILLIIFGIYGLIGVGLLTKCIVTGEYRSTIDEKALYHVDQRLDYNTIELVKNIVYWLCIPVYILTWPSSFKIKISFGDKNRKE